MSPWIRLQGWRSRNCFAWNLNWSACSATEISLPHLHNGLDWRLRASRTISDISPLASLSFFSLSSCAHSLETRKISREHKINLCPARFPSRLFRILFGSDTKPSGSFPRRAFIHASVAARFQVASVSVSSVEMNVEARFLGKTGLASIVSLSTSFIRGLNARLYCCLINDVVVSFQQKKEKKTYTRENEKRVFGFYFV